jgi:hypothetical protein
MAVSEAPKILELRLSEQMCLLLKGQFFRIVSMDAGWLTGVDTTQWGFTEGFRI